MSVSVIDLLQLISSSSSSSSNGLLSSTPSPKRKVPVFYSTASRTSSATPASLRQCTCPSSELSMITEIPHAQNDLVISSDKTASQLSLTHVHSRHKVLEGAHTLPTFVYILGPVAIHWLLLVCYFERLVPADVGRLVVRPPRMMVMSHLKASQTKRQRPKLLECNSKLQCYTQITSCVAVICE